MTKIESRRTDIDVEKDNSPTPRKPPESEPEEWPEGPKDDDQRIVDPVKI